MKKEINIGLVGYKFMGKAHSHAYKDVASFFKLSAKPVMKALCGRDEKQVKKVASDFGWESYETSWERLVKREDIDVIDICTPGNLHKVIALAAAKEGKDIICEKPLANSLAEAKEMLGAVRRAGVKNMVAFNYRRVPAVCLAKKLIEEGRLGKIYHFRAVYLQDWIVSPDFPLVWRLKRELAGSGAHGDINSHIIDLSHYLVGEITEVVGMQETFIKKRPLPEEATGLKAKSTKRMGRVTVDDATLFLARFKSGALGSFEASRLATGRKNYNYFEVNGSKGSLFFNLERLNELYFYSREDAEGTQGFKNILVTEESHPYISAWWPPGHIIGWEHTFVHEIYDFLQSIAQDKTAEPSFTEGVRCQEVLEAVERSARGKSWVAVG